MLAAILRPGNAGANNAADHLQVFELALAQLRRPRWTGRSWCARTRPAPATRSRTRAAKCFSFGYKIDERVRAAILALPERAWRPAVNGDDEPREGASVTELTGRVGLDAWPDGSRLIGRRERPHPGAQLSFTDHDGRRFQCCITDQPDRDLAALELRHREHAIVEDRIRALKSTGLSNLPFSAFAADQAWLEAALVAHDLTVWTQLLLFDGDHQVCEPKRLRVRLLHVAARLTRHAPADSRCTYSPTGPGPTPSRAPSSASPRYLPDAFTPPPTTTAARATAPTNAAATRARERQRQP